MHTELEKMLDGGITDPSTSPWASLFVLVMKKDGSTRFCMDYRRLTDVTRKDAYPLPRIDDTLDSLAGAQWFSTLDLTSGYWQVEMDHRDAAKTAFSTREGLFEFEVMPFGHGNGPATFESLMEQVLRGLQWRECLVYLDDVIVFGSSFEVALWNLRHVFDRLQEAGLKLKPKCAHFRKTAAFLGHVVSAKGVQYDLERVRAVQEWRRPGSVRDLRSFLGFTNYNRRFILDFATAAEPLTHLTRMHTPYRWTEECEQAFNGLRRCLTSAPVLAYPEADEKFILDTDASATGMGAVLSQIQGGEEKVIAYGSKNLRPTQHWYCTTNQELLAIVTFVKQFRHYLQGMPFQVRRDHASLVWHLNFKEPEGMAAGLLSWEPSTC